MAAAVVAAATLGSPAHADGLVPLHHEQVIFWPGGPETDVVDVLDVCGVDCDGADEIALDGVAPHITPTQDASVVEMHRPVSGGFAEWTVSRSGEVVAQVIVTTAKVADVVAPVGGDVRVAVGDRVELPILDPRPVSGAVSWEGQFRWAGQAEAHAFDERHASINPILRWLDEPRLGVLAGLHVPPMYEAGATPGVDELRLERCSPYVAEVWQAPAEVLDDLCRSTTWRIHVEVPTEIAGVVPPVKPVPEVVPTSVPEPPPTSPEDVPEVVPALSIRAGVPPEETGTMSQASRWCSSWPVCTSSAG